MPGQAPSPSPARDTRAPEADALTRADVELGCSEACSNVVRHAYGPADAAFEMRAGLHAGTVELRISDRGRWREPRGRHGGRGISLMRALFEEVVFDQNPDGTTVTLRRQLVSQPATIRASSR